MKSSAMISVIFHFLQKKYLENLYIWQNNILGEFEFQLKNSMKRINETVQYK